MAKTKCVYLTQYYRYGDTRTRTKDLELSLEDEEVNYYICRQDLNEVEADFDLVTKDTQNPPGLAIIHTQNGWAFLEALVPGVSVSLLGKGFDGKSAHDFRVNTSSPSNVRSFLQLRPGETFFVLDLCLTLIPEKYDDYTPSSGPAYLSYERYSQHVSQTEGESQPIFTPSPRKPRQPAVFEAPKKRKYTTPGNTPLIQQLSAAAMNGDEDSQEWPPDSNKRELLRIVREANRHINDPIPSEAPSEATESAGRVPNESHTHDLDEEEFKVPHDHASRPVNDTLQGHASDALPSTATHNIQESLEPQVDRDPEPPFSPPSSLAQEHVFESRSQLSDPGSSLQPSAESSPHAMVPTFDVAPLRKKRRLSPNPAHRAEEESQDSLAGNTIQVVARGRAFAKNPTAQTASFERSELGPSFHARKSVLGTQSVNKPMTESPAHSVEPPSSMRSTRSVLREDFHHLNVDEYGIRILFASSSSVGDSKVFKKFLSEQGVKVVREFKDATCLCIGKGELKKTSKLISAVLMGKEIIRDDWIIDSARLKKLQGLESYLARDPQREREWGIKLDEAIKRGKQGARVLADWSVIITASAKKELGKSNFSNLKEITLFAGAKNVTNLLPKKGLDKSPSTFLIGTQEDIGLSALESWKCYTKDIISLSILRGSLDLDSDEFLIQEPEKHRKGDKKRKC